MRLRAATLLSAFLLLPACGSIPEVPAEKAATGGELFRGLTGILATWEEAWRTDRPRDAAELYADEAVLVLPDGRWVQGRHEIRQALEYDVLPASREMLLRPLDFLTSGQMAFSTGRFWYRTTVDGVEVDRSGTYAVVFRLEGNDWKIRTQVFAEEVAPGM